MEFGQSREQQGEPGVDLMQFRHRTTLVKRMTHCGNKYQKKKTEKKENKVDIRGKSGW